VLELNATSAQIALAWLLAQKNGDYQLQEQQKHIVWKKYIGATHIILSSNGILNIYKALESIEIVGERHTEE